MLRILLGCIAVLSLAALLVALRTGARRKPPATVLEALARLEGTDLEVIATGNLRHESWVCRQPRPTAELAPLRRILAAVKGGGWHHTVKISPAPDPSWELSAEYAAGCAAVVGGVLVFGDRELVAEVVAALSS
jgi:hypothetical protein